MYYFDDEELYHYGMKYRSGRYPYGSGEIPFQHDGTATGFRNYIVDARNAGYSDADIAKSLGVSINAMRSKMTIANDEIKGARYDYVKNAYLNEGKSKSEIARELNVTEGTIRNTIKQIEASKEVKESVLNATVESLRAQVDKYGMIDVGKGSECHIGVSEGKKNAALEELESEGYKLFNIQVEQVTNKGKKTTVVVLAKPDLVNEDEMKFSRYAYTHIDEIHPITDNIKIVDGSAVVKSVRPPVSMDSKRLGIVYAEEGGTLRDGTMIIRPSAKDLTLTDCEASNQTHYAQVRISVDDKYYLKGMAMYGKESDFPAGTDIIFYTNKHEGTPVSKVLKKMNTVTDENGVEKVDMENPFGAAIKANGQPDYINSNGEKIQGCVNKLKEEGEWNEYSKNLSAQFLSKQPQKLITQQLNASIKEKQEELDSIMSISNDTVRKKFLEDFADECEAAAVELKAAAVPGQLTQVLLPVPELKSTEIYAPNYENGTQVALVRYPHAGTFEIPVLTVNNNRKAAVDTIGKAKDAVGVNPDVAQQLSGADFDGDTVVVIPQSDKVRVSSRPYLKDLVGFDPKEEFPCTEATKTTAGYSGEGPGKTMTKKQRGMEMGRTTNLIMDMTLLGADEADMVRAVKHSMVVIDAYKHNLDWQASAAQYDIQALNLKYRGRKNAGASTLITKAGAEYDVPKRKEGAYLEDPETGKLKRYTYDPKTGDRLYTETGEGYVTKTGKQITFLEKSTKMKEAKDAYELLGKDPDPKEILYANYANTMKQMARDTRLVMMSTPDSSSNKEAKAEYKEEVASLNAKLKVAIANAPLERLAQMQATAAVKTKIKDNPDVYDDSEAESKLRNAQLNVSRGRVGASGKGSRIVVTQKEWEAIEAGAVGHTVLSSILAKSDTETIRNYATPKQGRALTDTQISRIQRLSGNGATQKEIANTLGISVSTVSKYIH